jgi:hypothetical protein
MTVSCATPLLSIFAGDQTCVGFVFARGASGWEGFHQERSLGMFPSQASAIAAVAEAAKETSR